MYSLLVSLHTGELMIQLELSEHFVLATNPVHLMYGLGSCSRFWGQTQVPLPSEL